MQFKKYVCSFCCNANNALPWLLSLSPHREYDNMRRIKHQVAYIKRPYGQGQKGIHRMMARLCKQPWMLKPISILMNIWAPIAPVSYVVNCIPSTLQTATHTAHTTHHWEGGIHSFYFSSAFMSTTSARYMSIGSVASRSLTLFAHVNDSFSALSTVSRRISLLLYYCAIHTVDGKTHTHTHTRERAPECSTDCRIARFRFYEVPASNTLHHFPRLQHAREALPWILPHLCDAHVTFDLLVWFSFFLCLTECGWVLSAI